MNENQLSRVLKGESSINTNSAKRILTAVEDYLHLELTLDEVFYIENLKGNANILERTVEYIYGIRPLSKTEIADLVKYAFEGKSKGFSLKELLEVLVVVTIIITIGYYIYLYYRFK